MTGVDPIGHIAPLPLVYLEVIAEEIVSEVERQEELARAGKFGGTHVMPGGTDLERLAVLAEKFGEVSIEVCKAIRPMHDLVRRVGLREELVQTAAVCLAWIVAIDDGRSPKPGKICEYRDEPGHNDDPTNQEFCPTCGGSGVEFEDSMTAIGVPGGMYPVGPCRDCVRP